MPLFRLCLKDAMDGACFVCLGKLFHVRIVKAKKELKYRFVLAWSVRMSFAFLRLNQWFPESMEGQDLRDMWV